MYTCKPESLCYTVEIATTLQINSSSINKKAKPLPQRPRAKPFCSGAELHRRQRDPPPCSLAAGAGGGGMEAVGANSQPDPECELCLCRGIWNLPPLF